MIDGELKSHYLAQVVWFKLLPNSLRFSYRKPVEVWYRNQFEQQSSSMYIPVQRIKSKFVYATESILGKDVIVVCPRERYIVWTEN